MCRIAGALREQADPKIGPGPVFGINLPKIGPGPMDGVYYFENSPL